VHSDGSFGL